MPAWYQEHITKIDQCRKKITDQQKLRKVPSKKTPILLKWDIKNKDLSLLKDLNFQLLGHLHILWECRYYFIIIIPENIFTCSPFSFFLEIIQRDILHMPLTPISFILSITWWMYKYILCQFAVISLMKKIHLRCLKNMQNSYTNANFTVQCCLQNFRFYETELVERCSIWQASHIGY